MKQMTNHKNRSKHHRSKILTPPQKRTVETTQNVTVLRVLTLALFSVLLIMLISSLINTFGATGRAIQTVEGYQLNLTLIDNWLLVSINASDSAGSSRTIDAISFNLTANFDVCTYSSNPLLGWEFPIDRCSNQEIEFGYATIDPAKFKTYRFDVVEFSFPTIPYGDITFNLSELRVWDTSTGTTATNLFASDDFVSVHFFRDTPVVAAAAPDGSGSSSSSGGGGGFAPASSGSSIECIRLWQCAEWTECRNGQQRRSCSDEHNCAQNTSVKIGYKIYPVLPAGPQEPAEARSCQEENIEQLAELLQPEQQEPGIKITRQPESSQIPSPFFQKYRIYAITLLGMVLGVLLLVITIIHHRHKPHYNYDELKAWVRQEHAAGTSYQNISEIIQQKTSWKKEEVQRIFKDAGK